MNKYQLVWTSALLMQQLFMFVCVKVSNNKTQRIRCLINYTLKIQHVKQQKIHTYHFEDLLVGINKLTQNICM